MSKRWLRSDQGTDDSDNEDAESIFSATKKFKTSPHKRTNIGQRSIFTMTKEVGLVPKPYRSRLLSKIRSLPQRKSLTLKLDCGNVLDFCAETDSHDPDGCSKAEECCKTGACKKTGECNKAGACNDDHTTTIDQYDSTDSEYDDTTDSVSSERNFDPNYISNLYGAKKKPKSTADQLDNGWTRIRPASKNSHTALCHMLIQTRSSHRRSNTLKTYYAKLHSEKQSHQLADDLAHVEKTQFVIIDVKRELHWVILQTQKYDFLTYPDRGEVHPVGILEIENFEKLNQIQSRQNAYRSIIFIHTNVSYTVTSSFGPTTNTFFECNLKKPIVCTLQEIV